VDSGWTTRGGSRGARDHARAKDAGPAGVERYNRLAVHRPSPLLLLAIAASAALAEPESRACSCVGPQLSFLSPVHADDAPLNVHVRIEAPSSGLSAQTLVLRVHDGSTVAAQVRTIPGPTVTIAELVPAAPLAPLTRYEVATVDATKHPATTVIGTFKTGTSTDTKPPRLERVGRPRTTLNTQFGGGDCSIQGPWITVGGIVARDPDRPGAQLAYGVWQADKGGKLDTTRPPDALVFPYQDTIAIGQTSLCDMHAFAFDSAVVSLAIAAIDESGNASPAVRLRADVTRSTP
jgi:hypothetical protein